MMASYNLESTIDVERRFPELFDMNYKNLNDFMNSYPHLYNLYYPEPHDSAKRFDIILRILPEPASRIYAGVKKYELRKYVPKHTGFVFLMETRKEIAFTGCFFFRNFIADRVTELWAHVGERATRKERFDSYFGEKEYGVALEIMDFEKFKKPISIESIYARFEKMPHLPQPYVYLYTSVGSELSKILREPAEAILKRNNL